MIKHTITFICIGNCAKCDTNHSERQICLELQHLGLYPEKGDMVFTGIGKFKNLQAKKEEQNGKTIAGAGKESPRIRKNDNDKNHLK